MATTRFVSMQIDKKTAPYILSIYTGDDGQDIYMAMLYHVKTMRFVKGFMDGNHINVPSANSWGWYVEDFSKMTTRDFSSLARKDYEFLGKHCGEVRGNLMRLMAMELVKGVDDGH